MQFPASVPARALPESDAAWTRAAQQTRGYHYAAWGPDVLVDVHISKLAGALPALDFVFGVGERRHLPLRAIVFFLGRLGWVEDGSLAVDLTSGLSAATLVSFEAWADGDGRLGWSPPSETGFLQRMLTLAAELATGVLPAELKVTAYSFVTFEGHDDSTVGPGWTDSCSSRMTIKSLARAVVGPVAFSRVAVAVARRSRRRCLRAALAPLAPAQSCRRTRGGVALGRRFSAAAARFSAHA